MGDDDTGDKPRRSLYTRIREETAAWVGILVGVTVIVGAVAAWLWPDPGPPPEARYREELYAEVCQGELAAAATMAEPSAYAGSGGRIDRAAWLSAMDGVRTRLAAGRDGMRDPEPPTSLRDEWLATLTALDGFIRHWDEYRAYTATVPASQLTVFDYPNGTWKAKNSSAGATMAVPFRQLMGKQCEAPGG